MTTKMKIGTTQIYIQHKYFTRRKPPDHQIERKEESQSDCMGPTHSPGSWPAGGPVETAQKEKLET